MQDSILKESEIYKALKEAVIEKLSATDKEIETVNFVFWLTCFIEKEIFTKVVSTSISQWAKLAGMKNSDEYLLFIFDEVSFMGKIKILEKGFDLYGPGNPGLKPFIRYCKELSDLRNIIAHHKFSNLKWRGKDINEEETKSLMIQEFETVATNFKEGRIHQKDVYSE